MRFGELIALISGMKGLDRYKLKTYSINTLSAIKSSQQNVYSDENDREGNGQDITTKICKPGEG